MASRMSSVLPLRDKILAFAAILLLAGIFLPPGPAVAAETLTL